MTSTFGNCESKDGEQDVARIEVQCNRERRLSDASEKESDDCMPHALLRFIGVPMYNERVCEREGEQWTRTVVREQQQYV